MKSRKRVKSVLELGRYQIGDSAYWVTFRRLKSVPDIPEKFEWMLECHPKVIYERGPYKKLWDNKKKLPKLHHEDFNVVVSLLQFTMVIEEFQITDIIRSNNTGEYYYSNSDDEWMPESNLFDSMTAARREKNRIAKMINNWSKKIDHT
jgi:hypothetical protein